LIGNHARLTQNRKPQPRFSRSSFCLPNISDPSPRKAAFNAAPNQCVA
jgi:hypothetical protein